MTAKLTLYTLGQFTILLDGRPLTGISSRTAEALLIYLMGHRRPLSRQVLADFFWDERSTDRAAANLRTLLTMMRKALGDFLIIDRYHVSFNFAADYWLDVQELEERLATLASIVQSPTPLTAENAADLQSAIDLYQGPFLTGFYLPESRGFDEWITITQERLRHQTEIGLRRLVAHFLENGLYEVGRPYAARLLALDPYYESGHRQMMWLLVRSGQRNAALDHYQQCRQLLAEELDVEPSPATTAVYNQIRSLELPPPCRLPPQPTLFIGRETELVAIGQQLARPDCRLLTLLGTGGAGKTRLAIEMAAQIWQQRPGQFLHGIYFIPLENVPKAQQLPLILAEQLSISLRGPAEPLTLLLNYLRDKEMLLILDNIEHLLAPNGIEVAGLLSKLLQEAPQVKFLVTSRHRLNLQEEWLFDLSGLDYPLPTETGVAADVTEVEQYNAPRLFLHQARRVRHDFSPTAADWSAIGRLCQLLEGLPLGLELAATWLRHLGCAQIVDQVEKQPDALTSSYYNVIDRHRSLTAVFAYSWNLLTSAEQLVLPRLTILPSGFTLAAATAVAQANAGLLSNLVDKSLLRQEVDGRYRWHTLLSQLSAAHLPAEEQAATAAAHARYFAAHLQAQETELDGPQAESVLAELRVERPNLYAAWEWGVTHRAVALLDQMVGGLAYLDDIQGAFQIGYERCAAVSDDLLPASEAEQRLLGRCLAYQARFAHQLGRFDEANSLYQESIARLRPLGASGALALALTYWGELARQEGDIEAAQPRHQESLAIFRQLEDNQGIARALLHQANLAFIGGQLNEAMQQYEEGLAICQGLGSYRQAAVFLDNLGSALIELGQYDRAEAALIAALQRREVVNDQWGLATSNNNLGVLAGLRGDFDQAEKRYQAAAAAYRQLGYLYGVARCLSNLGSMLVSQGEFVVARSYLTEARSLWQVLGSLEGEADTLSYLGRAASQQERYSEAVELLRQSANIYRQVAHSLPLTNILTNLSIAYGRLGRSAEARAALRESVTIAEATKATPELLRAIIAGADLLAQEDKLATAVTWFEFALNHPQTTQPVRNEASRLRQLWPAAPPTPDSQPATLDGIMSGLRQLLSLSGPG